MLIVFFLTFILRFIALRLSFSPVAMKDNFGLEFPFPPTVESLPGLFPDLGPGLRFGLLFPRLYPGEDLTSSIEVELLGLTKVRLFCYGLSPSERTLGE